MKTNWLCDKFWCRLIHLKIILWNKPLEIGLCNKAIESNKVVLGICLGSQLIGESLGAKFEHSPEREIGKFL